MEPNSSSDAWLIDGAGLRLDRHSPLPLAQQLLEQLKAALQLAERGARLPPSRTLAQALGVGRNTVLAAYERLADEGFVEGRFGAGTRLLQPQVLPPPPLVPAAAAPDRWPQLPTPLGGRLGPPRPFAYGLPPLDLFPFEDWARLQRRHWRRCQRGEQALGYGAAEGEPRLRSVLASWLRQARGLRCTPEQLLITSGAQQAFALLGLGLLGAGERVAVESPGYHASWAALQLSGAQLLGLPVDAEGLRVAALQALGPCRMALVTPSHQWPTGACMGLARRLALVDWAQRQQAWLVEDDYAGEYRFDGPPLPALSSLDRSGRCIYVGSFSKLLLPGLRLGYLVLPPALVPLLQKLRAALDRQPPQFEQAVLADFIEQGLLARHLRRCRRAAAARRAPPGPATGLEPRLWRALAAAGTGLGLERLPAAAQSGRGGRLAGTGPRSRAGAGGHAGAAEALRPARRACRPGAGLRGQHGGAAARGSREAGAGLARDVKPARGLVRCRLFQGRENA